MSSSVNHSCSLYSFDSLGTIVSVDVVSKCTLGGLLLFSLLEEQIGDEDDGDAEAEVRREGKSTMRSMIDVWFLFDLDWKL